MQPDPYETPSSRTTHRPGGLARAARGSGGWLRRHPVGALQILLIILLLIVVGQNMETTSIDLLFWRVAELPKLALMLISMVAGALVWEAARRRWLKPARARGATTSQTPP